VGHVSPSRQKFRLSLPSAIPYSIYEMEDQLLVVSIFKEMLQRMNSLGEGTYRVFQLLKMRNEGAADISTRVP
jgi:hypothetical protein